MNYQQMPPTNGKVVLNTTCGDIEIELWSKVLLACLCPSSLGCFANLGCVQEAPLACRNFIQLGLEVKNGWFRVKVLFVCLTVLVLARSGLLRQYHVSQSDSQVHGARRRPDRNWRRRYTTQACASVKALTRLHICVCIISSAPQLLPPPTVQLETAP